MTEAYKIGHPLRSKPIPRIPAGQGFRKLDLAPYMRSPVNARDIAAREMITLADRLRYRHMNNPEEILVNAQSSYYGFQSSELWGERVLELNIAHSGERNHAILREVEGIRRSELIALEIKCKKPYPEIEDVSGYKGKYVHSEGGFLLDEEVNLEEYIWDGYLKENNLWSYFSPQFDDSLFKIRSLQIHPIGHLVLTYKDLEELDNNMLICSAIAMGIVLKIPTIYYKFGGDSIYGVVEKSIIPTKELSKVESIFEDMSKEYLVFKLNIASADIEKLEISSGTKAILLQRLNR